MSPAVRICLVAFLASIALLMACGDDDKGQIIGDCFTCKCNPALCDGRNLATKEDVIKLFEYSYNTRNIDYYDTLLDDDFHFYFSSGDVAVGNPELWDRGTEITTVARLLDPTYANLPAQSVAVDILTGDGVIWTAFNPPSAPSETWYKTTLFYDFKFEIAPNTYIPLTGARAEFSVRDAGPNSAYPHHWQLVEMRDLPDVLTVATSSSATEPATWGKVKVQYFEEGCLNCLCNPAFCPLDHNLSLKNYVLKNILDAYNGRHIDLYDALLDNGFTFFYTDPGFGDVQWNRATEKDIHTRLFDENYAPLPAQSIALDLETGEFITWMSFNPASAPNETWYSVTLFYDFHIEIAPNTYIPAAGSRAVFTVRDTGPDGEYAHHWQMVEMRDLGGPSLVTRSTATEASMWGQVKGLYR